MTLIALTPLRFSLVLLISMLFVSGCSSSSNSESDSSQPIAEVTDANGTITNDGLDSNVDLMEDLTTEETSNASMNEPASSDGDSANATGVGSDTESNGQSTTLVTFDITVPVYTSDALQVRLEWGDIDSTAIWNRDELWTASLDFPVNTANQLVITFSDGNGALTLGRFETAFGTGASPSESFQIAADEFDTDQWDSDGDGVSNLSESIAGTNPQGSDVMEPIQASLELVQDKTFRISWQRSEDAHFYRVFENLDGVSGFTDISGELDATTTTFDHRVALFARINAQYFVQSCNDLGCTDSDLQMVTGSLESAIGYFKADASGRDFFGVTVDLSDDGSTMAVGAFGDDRSETGEIGSQGDFSAIDTGAVYIFIRTDGQWQQQAYLKASNAAGRDNFGISIGLSADGNTLAVGADGEDSGSNGINGDQNDNTASGSGAVYVFSRNNESWQQQAYIKASNTDALDGFGRLISLSSDSDTLVVGALGEDSSATTINGDQADNSNFQSGAAYVFVRRNGVWQQQAYLKTTSTILFGVNCISSDGNTLVLGSYLIGTVFVFIRNGDVWQEQTSLQASNHNSDDGFGRRVSLSADGNTLAVSAEFEDSAATGINGDENDDSAENSGAAYVFIRSDGIWLQQAYLKASNTDIEDSFGFPVSLSSDGNTLVTAARLEDSAATGINGNQSDNQATDSGAVYVFTRIDERWQQLTYLKASNTNAQDNFSGVSISGDGNTLAIGAGGEMSASTGINGNQSDNSIAQAGALYLY